MNGEAMSQVWFDRKFDFSFPLEQLPDVCARLRSTPTRLENAMRGRTLQALVRKPDGKWSAQENAGHMLDLEPLWIVRIADYVNGSAQLTEADLTNRQTDEANHNTTPTGSPKLCPTAISTGYRLPSTGEMR